MYIIYYVYIYVCVCNLNQDEYSWPWKIMISHIPMQVWKWWSQWSVLGLIIWLCGLLSLEIFNEKSKNKRSSPSARLETLVLHYCLDWQLHQSEWEGVSSNQSRSLQWICPVKTQCQGCKCFANPEGYLSARESLWKPTKMDKDLRCHPVSINPVVPQSAHKNRTQSQSLSSQNCLTKECKSCAYSKIM